MDDQAHTQLREDAARSAYEAMVHPSRVETIPWDTIGRAAQAQYRWAADAVLALLPGHALAAMQLLGDVREGVIHVHPNGQWVAQAASEWRQDALGYWVQPRGEATDA